jgi:hypothetical protein
VFTKQRQFVRIACDWCCSRLCARLEQVEPEQMAEELTLLMEGAQLVAQNKGISEVGDRLIEMARRRV